jgi:hypothetical protein
MKHTQGKWTVHYPGQIDKRIYVLHPDGSRIIAGTNEGFISNRGTLSVEERIANAEIICRAVNNHERLVEALKLAERAILNLCDPSKEYNQTYQIIRAALEAAGEV